MSGLALAVMTPAQFAAARRATAKAKNLDFACLECGKRMSGAQAMRAQARGCGKCGGYDIDVAPKAVAP